jgi:hypothetical protein
MTYATLGAAIGLLALAPLGLPGFGLATGFFLGLNLDQAERAARDESDWPHDRPDSDLYRRGMQAFAACFIALGFGVLILGNFVSANW